MKKGSCGVNTDMTNKITVSLGDIPLTCFSRFGGKRGVRSAECGVRSVENAECGKCGVWKTRSVENAECGKCGVWKMRSVKEKYIKR